MAFSTQTRVNGRGLWLPILRRNKDRFFPVALLGDALCRNTSGARLWFA
jgi:hypothetical protein